MYGLVKVAGEWIRPSEIVSIFEDAGKVRVYFRGMGSQHYLRCTMEELEATLQGHKEGPYR